MRRIGVLLPAAADDPVFQSRVKAFLEGLEQWGWTIGRNVRIDMRWATTNAAEIRRHAAELAALAPDVILAHGVSTVGAMVQATRTVPIVFPVAGDPVAVSAIVRHRGNFAQGRCWPEPATNSPKPATVIDGDACPSEGLNHSRLESQ
jgi:putative tryptophan/tyrosine transport system substrate-binding protein